MKNFILFVMLTLCSCGSELTTFEYLTTTTTTTLPILPVYTGCYQDTPSRVFTDFAIQSNADYASCIGLAQTLGYRYAGLEYGGQCFLSNEAPIVSLPETACNMPCSINNSEFCGGSWAMSVWQVFQ